MDSFSLRSVFDASPVSKDVQDHLVRTYRTLAVAVAVATAAVYAQSVTLLFMDSFIPSLAAIGTLIWLVVTPPAHSNIFKREMLLYTFAGFSGLQIGPLVTTFLYIDSSVVFQAAIATTLVFASFTASALLNRDRTILLWGGFLSSALSILFWMGLFNVFFRSEMLFDVQLYGGLLLMSAFVLFDTQVMIAKAQAGIDDHVGSALSLFTDLINIFVRLIIIISRNRNSSSNERDRRRAR
eukprot:Unigene1135_Nuclearia_a/m.3658 Unigene1135_Nuclearia_a/g.3658  ORF Unigene1135_Nuclearia_a/g.3658 Unigene1135_Nuclearia_a/m.3658 type:complete len:239 (-) Unigene1135_Nuclearia_a:92-808(-)